MLVSLHDSLALIIEDLARQGWSYRVAFYPPALTAALAQECRDRYRKGELSAASIGRGADQQIREGIRGDQIAWLDADDPSPAVQEYLAIMDSFRQQLNATLFMGLEDYESHFARYPQGSFYARHLDRFRDDDRRSLSLISYLNPDWQPGDGGELRLYLDDHMQLEVQPIGGTLACFLSAEVPHEVLVAHKERLSLTGWFRRRGDNVLENLV